jgi:hypothetical protein
MKSRMSFCRGDCQLCHLTVSIRVELSVPARANDNSDTTIAQASLLVIDFRKSNELITK